MRYDTHRLDGATFAEELRSEVKTESGVAQRSRSIIRRANYSFALRRDTMMVTIDTIWLHENAEGVDRTVDVDPAIGARWLLLLDSSGKVTVEDEPVVTRDIVDVSDVRTAMDDFFPPPPPALAIRGVVTDSAHRTWRRLADSAGVQRYHLSQQQHGNGSQALGDSVSVRSEQEATEETDIAWDASRGPLAWSRHILSALTSRYSGRTMRASADQHIVVRRTH